MWPVTPVDLALRPGHLEGTWRDLAALAASTAALAPHYSGIRHPVTVMAGTEDRIVDTRAQSMRLAAEIPHATLQLLTGTGHMVHHARPDAVLAAIEEMTARVARRAAAH